MLLNHRGEPLTSTPDKPIYREIATGGEKDITRNWLGPLLQTQDTVLLTRGGGNLKAYEEIYRDDQVKTCVQNFIAAIVSRNWQVNPGKRRFQAATKQDEMAADFTREMIEALPWDNITEKMMYAWFYGYGIAEQLFAPDGGYVIWDVSRDETGKPRGGIKVKKARRFAFDPDGNLRLLTWGDQWQGEPLPQEKFWHLSVGADNDDDPHGFGWGHWTYWPVRFKREGMLLWLKFLEVCGVPARIGEYAPGASLEEQNRLLAAAESLGSASAAVIPQGMILRMLENTGRGTADNAELHKVCNEAIAKTILGQSLTTESAGGQYKGEVQMQVRQQLAQAASDRLCYSFCNGPLATLLFYNRDHFGEDVAIPRVWRDFDQEPDQNKRAAVFKILNDIGYETDDEEISKEFGGVWRKKQPPKPDAQNEAQSATQFGFLANFTEAVVKPRVEFAEPTPEPDPIVTWADQAAEQLAEPMAQVLERVRELVFSEDVSDLEGLREKMFSLYPELPIETAGAILGDLFHAADLAGKYEVQKGD